MSSSLQLFSFSKQQFASLQIDSHCFRPSLEERLSTVQNNSEVLSSSRTSHGRYPMHSSGYMSAQESVENSLQQAPFLQASAQEDKSLLFAHIWGNAKGAKGNDDSSMDSSKEFKSFSSSLLYKFLQGSYCIHISE